VIGHVPSSADLVERDPPLREEFAGEQEVLPIGAAAQGDDRGMFEEQESVPRLPAAALLSRTILQIEGFGVVDLPEPLDSEGASGLCVS
jgi:hypothetical protein